MFVEVHQNLARLVLMILLGSLGFIGTQQGWVVDTQPWLQDRRNLALLGSSGFIGTQQGWVSTILLGFDEPNSWARRRTQLLAAGFVGIHWNPARLGFDDLAGFRRTQPCWFCRRLGSSKPRSTRNRLGSDEPSNWVCQNPTLLGSSRFIGTQQGWVLTILLGFDEPNLAGRANQPCWFCRRLGLTPLAVEATQLEQISPRIPCIWSISQVPLRKEKKKKLVKIGFVDGVEMRKHSEKKKKWVKINFADGVEMREHSENKKI
ncbi:hypothetical protein SLEP1_g53796 [Rubroshorea leprosula]|uniref:Uncharacterized protein n=1 Tax=Rubroshorea leprosula TaxID=152421 RepID=A0AAV5MAN0_9ROSI|nr:hypothetical protein SLEP1_g53796 [Rubroshorea leprosula]